MRREKKLIWNTISAFIFFLCSITCGFIIPKLIFTNYGSEINGLVDSINNFLKVIIFLEFGIGAVVQSSLYKPLADKDIKNISEIIISARKFFRKIAFIFAIYIIFLIIIYPRISNVSFSFKYIALLIITISANLFAQYFFGIVDKIFLLADQKNYIVYNIQSCALILSSFISFILIQNGASIFLVELIISFVYILRPLFFYMYVRKNYLINYKIRYKVEPIKQKWNGIAQHLSAVVLDSTDSIILTVFSTLSNVSIYSVYYLVINGMRQVISLMVSGVQSLLGELLAKNEFEKLVNFFSWFEWLIHNIAILMWTCTIILIVPFVQIYTKGVTDVNYNVPNFAFIICLAFAFETLKSCYYILVLAAGHYKQTQISFIVTTFINIFISVILVIKIDLVGVALGTLTAMIFQLFWLALYVYKNILKFKLKLFIKQLIKDFLLFLIIYITYIFTKTMYSIELNYFSWCFLSLKIFFIAILEIFIFNIIFEKKKVGYLINKLRNMKA